MYRNKRQWMTGPVKVTKEFDYGFRKWTSASRSSFNPLSLSPALWLDASDSSTLYQSNGGAAASADGDPVGYWLDKSGNGRHLQQTDGTAKPLLKTAIKNGKNIIRFDGINDYIFKSGFTIAQPDTVCLVFKANSGRCIYDGASSIQRVYFYSSSFIYDAASPVTSAKAFDTNWNTCRVIFNGLNSKFYIRNSDATGSNTGSAPGSNSLSGVTIGQTGNGFWQTNMDFAEMLVFPVSLSVSDQNSVESYLNSKWAVY